MSEHLYSAALLGAAALLGDGRYLAPEQRVEIR